MSRTEFLDICLDLNQQTYAPYKKENNEIKYIRTESNHPSAIIKQIPSMIGKRITKRSINMEIFNKASADYNNALKKSGYAQEIKYEPITTSTKRKRKRRIVWFNPPFCRTVNTKIAKKFILLIEKHFHKDNPLRKIFNSNTINLSYSCMPNIGNIINMHNKKLMKKKENIQDKIKPCNCRKFECPLKNSKISCRTESVIYQATIVTNEAKRSYIGLTGREFKELYQHRHDFKNKNKMESTELSKHIWELKKNNKNYEIKWKILRKVAKINNGNKMCRLCITEAMLIMRGKKDLLNKRKEIMNKCRHENKFLLKNWKEKHKT